MDHDGGGSLEDWDAEMNSDSESLACEVSEGEQIYPI